MKNINKLKKINYFQKKKHIGYGGFNFWNTSISIGIIGSTVMKLVETITDITMKFIGNENPEIDNYNNYKFSSSNYRNDKQYIRLSKYPSNTNVTIGI